MELRRLRAMVQALEEDFFAPLGAADRAVLHELLTRLAARHDPNCCPLSEPDSTLGTALARQSDRRSPPSTGTMAPVR